MSLPDRWLDYSPMGEKISATRFIAMKVPLKDELCTEIGENEKFTCEMAIQTAKRKGYVLGLVIDLCFTRRYYNPKDFIENEVKYKKIFMEGRVLPSHKIMSQFYNTVKQFEEENEETESLIAVHCTHGLNRTGYMICKFLVDEKNYDPQSAIDAFNLARGHNMERELYINDLLAKASKETRRNDRNRFNGAHMEHPTYGIHPPELPYPPQWGGFCDYPQQNFYNGFYGYGRNLQNWGQVPVQCNNGQPNHGYHDNGFYDYGRNLQNWGQVPVQCNNGQPNHGYHDGYWYNDFEYRNHSQRGRQHNFYQNYPPRERAEQRPSPYTRYRNDWREY